MDKKELARKVAEHMLENDAFSKWLGIEIVDAAPGYSKLRMKVRDEMTNGFGITHGGVTFSLADSALAFAAGSHGTIAMALDNKITYVKAVNKGDVLTVESKEEHRGRQIGVYNITVTNQDGKTVAVKRGTVYRSGKEFPLE